MFVKVWPLLACLEGAKTETRAAVSPKSHSFEELRALAKVGNPWAKEIVVTVKSQYEEGRLNRGYWGFTYWKR